MESPHLWLTRQSLLHVYPPGSLHSPFSLPSPITSALLSFYFQTSPCLVSSNRMFPKIFSHDDGMSRILKAPRKNTPDFASFPRNVYMLFPSLECPLPSTTLCSQDKLRTLAKGNQTDTSFASHLCPSFLGTEISAIAHHVTASEGYSHSNKLTRHKRKNGSDRSCRTFGLCS